LPARLSDSDPAYFYLQGFGPIVFMVQGWWAQVSAPHANALQQ